MLWLTNRKQTNIKDNLFLVLLWKSCPSFPSVKITQNIKFCLSSVNKVTWREIKTSVMADQKQFVQNDLNTLFGSQLQQSSNLNTSARCVGTSWPPYFDSSSVCVTCQDVLLASLDSQSEKIWTQWHNSAAFLCLHVLCKDMLFNSWL